MAFSSPTVLRPSCAAARSALCNRLLRRPAFPAKLTIRPARLTPCAVGVNSFTAEAITPLELLPETKDTVKATVPMLKQHGITIVTRFYSILFERYPEVASYFNMDRQAKGKTKTDGAPAQVVALARSVLAYAQNIDNLEVLVPTVMSICHKHVSRGIEAPQYDAVGECLIAAISEFLGDEATPTIISAWTDAYSLLAKLFIAIEKDVRTKAAEAAGYDGFAKMSVKRIIDRADSGKVLYLLPTSSLIPKALKGQYAAVWVYGVPVYEESMLTAKIEEESTSELRLTVPANGESANTHLLSTVEVGDELTVGMPCGVVSA